MNETKRLAGYSYKLMGLGNIPGLPAQEQANQFGLDVPFGPDDLEIDENQMSCVIPFADGNRVDGSGDVIEVAGIKTERHRANPIVLFDHGKQVTLPVALSEDPITKLYTVEIDPIAKKAKGRAFFYQGKWGGKNFNGATEYDHALFCEQLFDLLAKRYIRAGSIGYQVMKGLPMQGTYGMGIPQGVHLQEVNMLEYSAVVLPCNQDTVGKALSLKRVCGKPLSSHLVKSLSPYAPPKKAQMGYEGQKTHGTLERWGGEDPDYADRSPTFMEAYVNSMERLTTPSPTLREMEGVAVEAGTVDEHGQIKKTEKSANIQQMQNARQQMRQETPPQRKQQAEEAQKTNKGQKALTPEQRQEMIDGSRLNSDEENIQAAEILRQIAGSPVRGDNPVDVVDEIVKPLEEESDKQADRKQHTKSFSALLKSLRAKYQVKANRVFSDQEGQRKPGHGEVPEVSFPTDTMGRESDLREQQYQQAYDPRQSNLDAYEAQQRFESSQPEFDRRMDQMEMQAGVLTTSRQHPERIYGQNNFDKVRLEGNMGDLPTTQGESMFSIGSNVDLKAMTPRQIADLRGVLGDMSPQMLRMLQAEQSDRLAGIDDEDDSNPTTADILLSVVEEQEKYGSDMKVLPEALTFLKYLASEDSSLDESGRMKCYHYAKSLEHYGGKMAIPRDYEVGREVVGLGNYPSERLGEGGDPNQLYEVDFGATLIPRARHTSEEYARLQFPNETTGLMKLSRLKYRDEASLPEQEQEQ